MEVRGNAEPLKDPACVGLRFPAAKLCKLLLKLGSPDAVLIAEVGLVVDGVLLLAAVIQALVAHDNGVHDGVGVVHILVLLQNAHALFGGDMHGAGGRLKFAGEYLYKGGFSGTVCADDAVAVAGGELQVDV